MQIKDVNVFFKRFFFVSSTLIFILTNSSFAKDDLAIMTENWPPLNYVKEDLLVGPSVDIVHAIQEKLNDKNEIVVLPWKRAYNYTLTKKNNILFSMARSEKRENLFKWIGPIAEKRYSFFAKKNFKFKINSLDDARKFTIGVQQGAHAEDFLARKGFKNLQKANTATQYIQMLAKNRFDLMLDSHSTVTKLIKELAMNKNDFKEVFVVKKTFLYIVFNKQTDDSIVLAWQKAYDELYAKGTIKEIYQKYDLEALYWQK